MNADYVWFVTCNFNCSPSKSCCEENYTASSIHFASGLCLSLYKCMHCLSVGFNSVIALHIYFWYISIILKFLLVKVVSDVVFVYLMYHLSSCLILGVEIYENASKDLLKIILKRRKDSMQPLHLLLLQIDVLLSGLSISFGW